MFTKKMFRKIITCIKLSCTNCTSEVMAQPRLYIGLHRCMYTRVINQVRICAHFTVNFHLQRHRLCLGVAAYFFIKIFFLRFLLAVSYSISLPILSAKVGVLIPLQQICDVTLKIVLRQNVCIDIRSYRNQK